MLEGYKRISNGPHKGVSYQGTQRSCTLESTTGTQEQSCSYGSGNLWIIVRLGRADGNGDLTAILMIIWILKKAESTEYIHLYMTLLQASLDVVNVVGIEVKSSGCSWLMKDKGKGNYLGLDCTAWTWWASWLSFSFSKSFSWSIGEASWR